MLFFNSFVNSVANQVVVINGNGRLVDSINTILYRLHSVLNRSDASQMARSLMKDEGTRILMKKPLTGSSSMKSSVLVTAEVTYIMYCRIGPNSVCWRCFNFRICYLRNVEKLQIFPYTKTA